MIPLLFSVLFLAGAQPSDTAATTSANAGTVATDAVPAKKKAEQKVCRDDPSYTGSRMRRKLCLTQTEWAMRAQGKSAGDLKTLGAR